MHSGWQQAKDPACYLKDSCCEKAWVELVALAFPLCEIWADKDRMLAAYRGRDWGNGGKRKGGSHLSPETWNQQFPDSLIRSATGGISSVLPLITHPWKGGRKRKRGRVCVLWFLEYFVCEFVTHQGPGEALLISISLSSEKRSEIWALVWYYISDIESFSWSN